MQDKAPQYYFGLDGLRALAAAIVIWGHVAPSLNWQADAWFLKIFNLFLGLSWTGVQLFFVLSGFLITSLLIQDLGKPRQLKNFFIRRSLRIFPIYYCALIACIIILPNLGYSAQWVDLAQENQFWYWTYLINWASPFIDTFGFTHFWSLAIEEQFYLFWPFLLIFCSRRTVVAFCWFMILTGPIARAILFYFFGDLGPSKAMSSQAAYTFTFARWDALAIGALLAIYKSEGKQALISKWLWPTAIVCALWFVVETFFNHRFASLGYGSSILNQSIAAIVFAIVIFCCAKQSDSNKLSIRFLESWLLKQTGKYSYAMYLLHIPVLHFWLQYTQVSLTEKSGWELFLYINLNCIAVFSITFVISAVTWKLIEEPFLKLKHKFN